MIQASILPDVGEVGEDLRGHSELFSFHLTSLTAPDVSCPCATIRNPLSDPGRYDTIEANDFLFMEFIDAPDGTPGIVNLQRPFSIVF